MFHSHTSGIRNSRKAEIGTKKIGTRASQLALWQANWVKSELERAIPQWRAVFRGDARVVDDTAVTPEMVANANLILWGDPSSNKVLARIVGQLPVKWSAETLQAGTKNYPAANHVPVLIYPNPLNPNRYVVLNSGFTFREYDYLNNARQVPKLPDWAVVDVNTPPSSRWPGKVVEAGFFGERWEFVENSKAAVAGK